MVVIKMNEIGKIIFKFEDYELPCSFEKCKKQSIAYYTSDGREIHLCEKHFKETVETFHAEGIETNSEKINEYFSKQNEQRNRPKGSGLKLSSCDNYHK